MDGIIKSPKNEIKYIQNIMNKSPSKRNYYSNIINPKNQINYMNEYSF